MKLDLHSFVYLCSFVYLIAVIGVAHGESKPRARDLGIPFNGAPGPFNAITDVPGLAVGHTTLISGHGKLKVGVGPVRTGVTAVLPRGKDSADPVFAGWFSQNGNGEMTGTTWVGTETGTRLVLTELFRFC
jgi:D-aminopeptidase